MTEPKYLRAARALMDVLTPEGIDGFIFGFVVALSAAATFAYWYWQL